jgi:tetratricopeptide (TPR) repeat protein
MALLVSASAHAEPSAMEQAEELFYRIAQHSTAGDTELRFRLADQAQALCEKVAAARSKDPAPLLCIARALTISDLAHPESCRPGACERAIRELGRARALDAKGIEAERIASELGIVYSRVGKFDEALAEYDRALRLVDAERRPDVLEDTNRSVLYGNSAETLMAMGRLDDAIARYRQAEEAAAPGGVEHKLALWGLGVALDRDEQVEKSREAIARAIEKDPTMSRLSDEAVFFEPPGDKSYYLGLGHEVAGERKEAMAAFNDYLAAQPRGRWVRRARAHVDALKKAPPDVHSSSPIEITIGDPFVPQPVRKPAQLAATLHEHDADLRLCHERAARAGVPRAQLRGQLRLLMMITPAGYPLPVEVMDSSTLAQDLVQCVREVAVNWRFSAVDGEDAEHLVIPIIFGGKRP